MPARFALPGQKRSRSSCVQLTDPYTRAHSTSVRVTTMRANQQPPRCAVCLRKQPRGAFLSTLMIAASTSSRRQVDVVFGGADPVVAESVARQHQITAEPRNSCRANVFCRTCTPRRPSSKICARAMTRRAGRKPLRRSIGSTLPSPSRVSPGEAAAAASSHPEAPLFHRGAEGLDITSQSA